MSRHRPPQPWWQRAAWLALAALLAAVAVFALCLAMTVTAPAAAPAAVNVQAQVCVDEQWTDLAGRAWWRCRNI